ncbi:hypothetical protein HZB96_01365 [Candidatus Gottesmanbacteria bacterium]|nr:hypothetical protein [Candidatus Gottesmanbacteria bacterium]
MKYRYDWLQLRHRFITGSWLTVADFFRDQGVKDNSRARLHTSGWIEEKRQYQKEIIRKTQEQTLEKEINIRVRQQKISQQLQLTGMEGLKKTKLSNIDTKTALKMLVSGLQEERAALGMDSNKLSVMTQVNVNPLPKTHLDEVIEKASYEELLQMIAEIKKLREQRNSGKEVEK